EDILLDVQQEKAAVSARVAEVAAAPLSPMQKINRIQQVLADDVRPMLLADGGDVELYEVSGDTVKVVLKGACTSCSSSAATLKGAIETRLQENVSPALTVIAV
ncbi:MAG: NifU family protein, partial [Cyanobacteria bacterium J06648_11]